MNAENTKKLIETAGPIFPPLPIDPRQNLMCFGFECGDGWFKILATCFAGLRKLREAGIAPHLTLIQVKEKFGMLRIYTAGEDPDYIVWAVTSFAERHSGQYCEVCGEYGKLRRGGWLMTLCNKHAEEKGYSLTEEDDDE